YSLQLPTPGPGLEGTDPFAAVSPRPLRAKRGDVPLGLFAREDGALRLVGRAVFLLGIPDVVDGPDGLLRAGDSAIRRAGGAGNQSGGGVRHGRSDAGRRRPEPGALA